MKKRRLRNKPSLEEATKKLIKDVRGTFPFNEPKANICADKCHGCPKKLLELVDLELAYWEGQLKKGINPNFKELNRLGKMCKKVKVALEKNGLIK